MRSLAYAIACGALFAGTSVQAQSMDITGVKSGSITSADWNVSGPNGYIVDTENALEVGYGGSAETKVKITPGHASFESGVAVSGALASATSNSGLDITINNNSTNQILSVEQFGSTIIPAGMGFYMQDRTGNAEGSNIYTGYGQNDFATLQDLWPSVGEGIFAYSSFDFTVVSNDQTLYTLSGYMSLSFGEGGVLSRDYGLTNGLGPVLDPTSVLNGFTSAYDNDVAYAFAWDSTDIDFDLNALIGPGGSQTIYYRTTVTSWTTADCLDEVTCLVAYSGFGDPIGRGGGISFASFAASDVSTFDVGPNTITGIVFDPVDVDRFELIDATFSGGAVPEPATWISMILGFGMLGAALRRRRVLSYS
ncbi:MAG: PEP-CTERM sorting domain-containing protein [Phenylobacterium sp.]|uniref:PEPxxWA-CTERM sorting domain-containing protein n=1 Tax=Phenylobacterium sp. TaxID=1871053 RepID=UPI0011F60ADA|nr:PEPxxWA-CTERM sorting domain-containing protein [Phenylobacterium sp.]TAJ74700.1 MAG: PEP-CTERM sorting domain-containing protein [Phenylobacterium sp.]